MQTINTAVLHSQRENILHDLKNGLTITSIDALHRYGCFRLGARIYDLKQEGWPINSKMVRLANGKKVARYQFDF